MTLLKAPFRKMALVLLGLPTAWLSGQNPSAGRPVPPHLKVPTGTMVQDSRFMARLFHIRVARIQQVLCLPEDRARALAERWGRWDKEHLERGQQAMEIRIQFNQILMGPEREEEKNLRLKPLMDQFMAVRQYQEAGRRQFEEDIRVGLTPAQQARLILVMEEIQQKLREGLRAVQGREK